MLRLMTRRLAAVLLLIAPLAVGTTTEFACLETVLTAANPCGIIFSEAYCTPDDWYRWVVWPVTTYPNYDADPSCVIPYACGDWFGTAGTRNAGGTGSTTTTSTTSTSTSSLF